MLRPPHWLLTLASLGIGLAAIQALAVGSGSGGTVPSCSADTWSCSDWGSCSNTGIQTRTCSLTYDCGSATTPRPAVEQRCTPPASPRQTTNQATTNANQQNTNAATSPNTNIGSACTQDTWTCGDWTSTCDSQGRQSRQCSVSNDCPSVATPPPEQFRPCQALQCSSKSTLRDRVFCRLNLAPEGLARELAIEFLPEECRVLVDQSTRQECIQYYRNYQPCWTLPAGENRFSCAKNVLKVGPIVSQEVRSCQGKTGQEQVTCKSAIREKVFDLIKFRFYDLEQRAEVLGDRGVDLSTIADFVTAVEQKKQAFNQAASKDERRQIILDVRQAWQTFIDQAKTQLHLS
ncbi:MAG: hypothetical protein HYY50_05295 [Candidatus Kerfeldbacteria bacterium]|nr:hypothetical protein [Candidatus Kerfeldbacteria bacterium]